jgi:hypothetical protein
MTAAIDGTERRRSAGKIGAHRTPIPGIFVAVQRRPPNPSIFS